MQALLSPEGVCSASGRVEVGLTYNMHSTSCSGHGSAFYKVASVRRRGCYITNCYMNRCVTVAKRSCITCPDVLPLREWHSDGRQVCGVTGHDTRLGLI